MAPVTIYDLPCHLMALIMKNLTYKDINRVSRTSQSFNYVFQNYRPLLRGPDLRVLATIQNGEITTQLSNAKQQLILVPEKNRKSYFMRAQISLQLFLLDSPDSTTVVQVCEMFETCKKVESIEVNCATVSDELKDVLNGLKPDAVFVKVQAFSNSLLEVKNILSLEIQKQIAFFQLSKLLLNEPQSLTIHTTIASLPILTRSIEEWRQSVRKIENWTVTLPLIDLNGRFQDVPIDWRRGITKNSAGTQTLTRSIHSLKPENNINYQKIVWKTSH